MKELDAKVVEQLLMGYTKPNAGSGAGKERQIFRKHLVRRDDSVGPK